MKTYLGDAVYADSDGFHVILTTENGIETTNTIFLDPYVIESLGKYLENIKALKKVKL